MDEYLARKQLDDRIEALRAVLVERNETILACQRALVDARMNRDRVAGGIVELEYAIEQAAGPAQPEPAGDGKVPTRRIVSVK